MNFLLAIRHLLILAIVFMFSHGKTQAQTIRGQVLDYKTKEPLPFVNVYFNGSYHGTTCDYNGKFGLNIGQHSGLEIVASCTGYQSHILKEYSPGTFYKIYLRPQAFLLKDVEVVANDIPREVKEKMFLETFLGNTKNAKKCTIDNLQDVKLVYLKPSKTLLAFCSKPLIIHNKALGLKITYFLKDFKRDENSFRYYGNSIFEDVSINSENEKTKLEKNKERAYLGSRMHFFRLLWNNELVKSNFSITSMLDKKNLSLEEYIEESDGSMKYLHCPGTLQVSYNYKKSQLIPLQDSTVHFARNGYFDMDGVLWRGDIAKQRVGDLLPFEYTLKLKK